MAARHSGPPRPAYRPSIPVEHLALPRRLLYESWHRARWPKVAAGDRAGRRHPRHRLRRARRPARPCSATMHDLAWRHDPGNFTKNGVMFFEAGLKRVVDDAALVLCPSQATLDDCAAAGIEREPPAPRPVGDDASPTSTPTTWPGWRTSYGIDGPLHPVRRHGRAPQEPAPAARRRVPPAARRRDPRRRGPAGLGRRPRPQGRRAGRPGEAGGVRGPPRPAAALRRRGGHVLPEPGGGLRSPRRRSPGLRRPRRHLQGHGHRGARRRRRRAWRSTRPMPTPSRAPSPRSSTTTTWPTACGRPGVPAPPRLRGRSQLR